MEDYEIDNWEDIHQLTCFQLKNNMKIAIAKNLFESPKCLKIGDKIVWNNTGENYTAFKKTKDEENKNYFVLIEIGYFPHKWYCFWKKKEINYFILQYKEN